MRVELRTVIATVLFPVLSLNAFFGFVLAIRFAGLKYQLNYAIMDLDLAIISPLADNLLWAVTGVFLIGASAALFVVWPKRVRWAWFFYALALALALVTFLQGQTGLAGGLTIIADLACLLFFSFGPRDVRPLRARTTITIFLVSNLLILLCVEAASAAVWIYNLYDPCLPFGESTRWTLPLLELKLASILYSFGPVLFLGAALSWIPILPVLIAKRTEDSVLVSGCASRKRGILGALAIAASLASSILIIYYPYAFGQDLRGVDAPWYFSRLSETRTLSDAAGLLLLEPRAPYLILLFLVRAATALPTFEVVKWGPLIPMLLLAFSMFLFARSVTEDWSIAGLAAFFGTASFHSTAGMYGGIYANWLAMTPMLLGLACLVRLSQTGRPRYLAGSVVASFTVLVVHGWTWGIMMASIVALFLVASIGFLTTKAPSFQAELKAAGVTLLLAVGPVAVLLLGLVALPLGPGFSAASSAYREIVGSMSLGYLPAELTILSLTLSRYVGGVVYYVPLFVLVVVGVISLWRLRGQGARLILAWLAATSVSALLVQPWYQWRIIYVMPLQVLVVLAVAFMTRELGGYCSRVWHFNRLVQIGFVLLVSLAFMNYALRGASFLPVP